jgi:hypothetical protein
MNINHEPLPPPEFSQNCYPRRCGRRSAGRFTAAWSVFRLADGRAHSLLFFRTIFDAEQDTGCRIGEVFSDKKNETLPWRF